MKINHENYEHITVMACQGEFTTEQVERFRKCARERMEQDVRDFVLDFSELEFVDSKGLETLIWLQDQVAERLGQVRLACLPENVEKVLEITRLGNRFDSHGDVDAAIKSLR